MGPRVTEEGEFIKKAVQDWEEGRVAVVLGGTIGSRVCA